MGCLEIILISIGLAMDTFAVSVCKGVQIKKLDYNKMIIVGLYFGSFQAIMPTIGYLLGTTFDDLVTQIDHWIAFALLSFIGLKMIKETLKKEESNINEKLDLKTMLVLAIATSIDALAVGITFAFLNVNLILSITIIGIITFLISIIGVKIGNKFGNKYEKKAEFVGGLILILLGFKILLEHLKII